MVRALVVADVSRAAGCLVRVEAPVPSATRTYGVTPGREVGAAAWQGGGVSDEAQARRDERAAQADYHIAVQRRRDEAESVRAQVLVDGFVEQATAAGLATQELTARPWSGRGRYRTGVTGWYLRHDQALGVDTEGRYYQLVVAPVRLGRWRTVSIEPTPPPLQTGKGGRDGDSVALDVLLAMRLEWTD